MSTCLQPPTQRTPSTARLHWKGTRTYLRTVQMDNRQRRSTLFNALKASGWVPQKHYRDYTIQELIEVAADRGMEEPPYIVEEPAAEYHPLPTPSEAPPQADLPALELPDDPPPPPPPVQSGPVPEELPNQRINTKDEEDVLRVDEQGRRWLQEEVKKPAYPKPRGRRVLTYIEHGVQKETVLNGEYMETFEVAGDKPGRPAEVKITLPSYQVGIYRDPRFPFRVHTYNGAEGFNLHDIHEFYGGAELVPAGVKRIYVENDLCYDIRSVIQAINAEYRQIQLTGKAYQ